jgi:hypothetical protein
MKALIWIGCTLAVVLINILLLPLEMGLGYILMYAILIVLPEYLCKKLDWYRIKKNATNAGMTVSEYGKQGLSQEFLTTLEKLCNTTSYERVKFLLKKCVKKGKITKEQFIILLDEYSTKK